MFFHDYIDRILGITKPIFYRTAATMLLKLNIILNIEAYKGH